MIANELGKLGVIAILTHKDHLEPLVFDGIFLVIQIGFIWHNTQGIHPGDHVLGVAPSRVSTTGVPHSIIVIAHGSEKRKACTQDAIDAGKEPIGVIHIVKIALMEHDVRPLIFDEL